MKAVPISVILFCVLILCIVLNSIFLRSTADRLTEFADRLSQGEEREETLSELTKFWEDRRIFIGLTVSNTQLDRAEEIVISLNHYHSTENEGEFQRYCSLLRDSAHCIRRVEELGLENLF